MNEMDNEYKTYNDIPWDVFIAAIQEIAQAEGVGALLSIPGVFELVCEEYNNEALDRLCPVTD